MGEDGEKTCADYLDLSGVSSLWLYSTAVVSIHRGRTVAGRCTWPSPNEACLLGTVFLRTVFGASQSLGVNRYRVVRGVTRQTCPNYCSSSICWLWKYLKFAFWNNLLLVEREVLLCALHLWIASPPVRF